MTKELNMLKNNVDAIAALKIAIQIEITLYRLYQNALNIVKNENSKDILKLLAEEEHSHKKRLENLYTNLSGRRIMALNLKPKMSLREITNEYISPIEVLEIAIENEKDSLRFYEEAAEKTVNYEGKRIFNKLIEEEKSHLELLEVEYKVRKKNFSDEIEEYQNVKEVSGIVN